MPKLILAVVLIVCLGAVMGLMGYVMTKNSVIENVINPEQALSVAKRTPEAREFVKLYPDARIHAAKTQIWSIGATAKGWIATFIEKPDIYPTIVSLSIHVNDNGTIDSIFPENAFDLIKNRKYCKTDNDCLSVECPFGIEYVNYVHAYADKCMPLLSPEGDYCHSHFISLCVNNKCYGDGTRIKIPTETEALKTANEIKDVREFLESYPDAIVSTERICCIPGGILGDWIQSCEKSPDFRGWNIYYKMGTNKHVVNICPINNTPGFKNF